jgi:hypothetical protein
VDRAREIAIRHGFRGGHPEYDGDVKPRSSCGKFLVIRNFPRFRGADLAKSPHFSPTLPGMAIAQFHSTHRAWSMTSGSKGVAGHENRE